MLKVGFFAKITVLKAIDMQEKLIQIARQFINSTLDFEWTEAEKNLVDKVFTNADKRVFFIYNQLPANMIAVLMAIYSRMRNKRGLRGTFVDDFIPHILSGFIKECDEKFEGKPAKFLKERKLKKLDDFINYSAETRKAYETFLHNLGDEHYLANLSGAKKMKTFLSTWLDKYGHNSIARPAMLYFCLENVSLLAAKSIEWTRPGSGYIELSTRYVDMHGKDVYPAHLELKEFGLPEAEVSSLIDLSFKLYRDLQGEDYDGPLPSFFREKYKEIIPEDKLEQGVIGETCDVLGNLLPCSTFSSLGVGASGEALPEIVRHLYLDNTPENQAIAELMIEEAAKVGADQFLRHLDISDWKKADWEYLTEGAPIEQSWLPDPSAVEQVLYQALVQKQSFAGAKNFTEVVARFKQINKTSFDKLPREFELINAVFNKVMSFRSWRDLHRMGFCMHRRGYVTPEIGCYNYDKPAPPQLKEAFDKLYQANRELFSKMRELNIPLELSQYPLAIGNLIRFTMAGNLRQMEFCNWQRSKPSVNHEVRQIFLWTEKEIAKHLTWWSELSRADTTPAYIFARGDSDVPLT